MRLRLAFRDADKRRRYGAVAISVALCYAAFIGFGAVSGTAGLNGFEVGKVADRDIVAEREIVYVDAGFNIMGMSFDE